MPCACGELFDLLKAFNMLSSEKLFYPLFFLIFLEIQPQLCYTIFCIFMFRGCDIMEENNEYIIDWKWF